MNRYRITFSNGDVETIDADHYYQGQGIVQMVYNGRETRRYFETNLRSIEKVNA